MDPFGATAAPAVPEFDLRPSARPAERRRVDARFSAHAGCAHSLALASARRRDPSCAPSGPACLARRTGGPAFGARANRAPEGRESQ
jgi:hypothetical protein